MLTALLLAGLLQTAANVKNPTSVTFKCPDHAQDTGHEIDIINAAGVVVQTILGGDPAADANGDVTVMLNVQPTAFGVNYTVVVRPTAGIAKADNSLPSNPWDRVPGSPSKPVVK